MLTNKEYRAAEIQAAKSQHQACRAEPKARAKLHASLDSVHATNVTLGRCRKASSKAKAKEKLCYFRIKAGRLLKRCKKLRGEIILARLILYPRLAWKTNSEGGLLHFIMPSDFRGSTYLLPKSKKAKK